MIHFRENLSNIALVYILYTSLLSSVSVLACTHYFVVCLAPL